jgi:hypothetical protein
MLAFVILHFDDKFEKAFFISPREWILLVLGAFVVFVSFIWDYSRFVINNIELDSVDSLGKHLEILTLSYTPVAFNWILYFSGVLLILAAIFFIYRRNKARHH